MTCWLFTDPLLVATFLFYFLVVIRFKKTRGTRVFNCFRFAGRVSCFSFAEALSRRASGAPLSAPSLLFDCPGAVFGSIFFRR